MTATTNNILLPYIEDTGLDGKNLYTSKEKTERMIHHIKRIQDIDIKPALSDSTNEEGMEAKRTHINKKIYLGRRTFRDGDDYKQRVQH